MKHGLPITLLAALVISGCNGGGGSSSNSSDSTTSPSDSESSTTATIEHPGLYAGTYLNGTQNQQGTMVLFITTDGKGYAVSDETEVIVGTVSESESNMMFSGNYYSEGSDEWGYSFDSNTTYNLGTLSGSYTMPGVEGTLSLIERSEILNRTIDITTLNGNWVDQDDGEVLTISNGTITHTDDDDCDATGTLTQIGTANQFNTTMTFTGCADPEYNGTYNGIMFTSDDTDGENTWINMIIVDEDKQHVGIEEAKRQ